MSALARMLDDRVRAGEHQGGVIVLKSHEVGRFSARSSDLDDLARPVGLAYDAAVHVDSVSDGCPHNARLLGSRSLAANARGAHRAATIRVGIPGLALESLRSGWKRWRFAVHD